MRRLLLLPALIAACALALLLVPAPPVAEAGAVVPGCTQWGGYPWVNGGCLNGQDINNAFSFNPSSLPPQNAFGQGALYGKLWLDTSTVPATLRECLISPNCSASYISSQWAVWGTLGSGTWTPFFSGGTDILPPSQGGTGINNGTNTLTLIGASSGNCLIYGSAWMPEPCPGGQGSTAPVSLNSSALIETATNDAGGTTQGDLVVYTSAATVRNAATSEAPYIFGVCNSGCGTSGAASIAIAGHANCNFDNAPTANDFVVVSTTVGAECHDTGSPTTVPTGVLVGRVLSSSATTGSYPIDIVNLGISAAIGARVPLAANPTASAGPTAINGTASTFMRSDAAPAVQFGSASQPGILEVGGGLSAPGGIVQLAPLSAISHEWIASIASGGAPQLTQPGCGDLSDFGTGCRASTGTSGHTVPFLDGANDWSAATQHFGPVTGSARQVTGTTDSLAASDCGGEVVYTNSGTVSVTTLANISPGAVCAIALQQEGTGAVQIVDGSSTTHVSTSNSCPSAKTSGQYAIMQLSVQPFDPSEYKVGGECS